MLKKDLLELIKDIDDNESIDEILKGTDFAKSMLSIDNFKNLVATNKEYKAFLDSEKDKHYSKALETWKANNLEKIINEEIRKRNPARDEKDIALEELQRKIEAMEKEKQYEKLKNIALKQATEKKLPSELVDYFIGQDEESTISNIEKLESVFGTHVETLVQERLKGNSYTPPSSTGAGATTYDDLLKNADNMSAQQVAEMFSKIGK